ncbi:LysM peptidoglycan-binding domain-containing protein [Neiella sp. HB171785]|uniref:LysM peptidoglycan-binding domain-containing protein n=1 Tax=Neiella litorisoli TaxID=2771431 RepID=A0A8J6R458_9GAMM|nr:LysM peptidoglycan-binding domain-containing protein [Neiella litorisoli]MBD1391180.1 LysM peptidoglycan-binding domain-containing protein [Neiella litorisoli]
MKRCTNNRLVGLLMGLLLAGCQSTSEVSEPTAQQVVTTAAPPALEATPQPAEPSKAELYLWHHMREGFALTEQSHPSIDKERKRYLRHKDVIAEIDKRAGAYLAIIIEQLEQHQMPLEIAMLPFVESGFDPYAYSHGGAVGMWQFMPATAKRFGLANDWWFDGRRDIYLSTLAAIDYLKYLHEMFDGDWLLALAAYNSGEGRVKRAVKKNKRRGKATDFFSLKLPSETTAYVPRLLAITDIVRNAEQYNMELPQRPNQQTLVAIDVGNQIELAIVAELAGMSLKQIAELNPGYNRWATAPTTSNMLLIPQSQQQQLEAGLAQLPAEQRVSWQRYEIRPGDSLERIAKKHHTTVKVLMTANNLRSHIIRAGRHLMIPLGDEARLPPLRLADDKPTKYQVQRGDSLWLIARRYKVKHQDIARWNGLSSNMLKPGQTLTIYTNEPQQQTKTVRYKVRNGDSLSLIAKRFDVSVSALKRWNSLTSDFLRAGQRLKIEVNLTSG